MMPAMLLTSLTARSCLIFIATGGFNATEKNARQNGPSPQVESNLVGGFNPSEKY